ncbi:MAG TPA: VanZ family protein [Thermoanaerobaculia bacterium]|nr:VanZ family protein [Thermoanaerobaculia bacterium]
MRRARLAAALWGGFLFLVTSWPNPPAVETGAFPLDKVTHFLLYGVEAFLLYRAIGWKGRSGFSLSRVLAITGVMAVWGALDEWHQEWIPGRMMDSADLAADVSGATVGAALAGAGSRLESLSRRSRSEPRR